MLELFFILSGSTLATYGLLRLRHLLKRRKLETMTEQQLHDAVKMNEISVYDIPASKRNNVENLRVSFDLNSTNPALKLRDFWK